MTAPLDRPDLPPPETRDQRRSRRRRALRPKTIRIPRKKASARELALVRELSRPDPSLPSRPATRLGCVADERPCPYVSCVHHLYLDVRRATGSITLNFPNLEPWELAQSCSLDVADQGGSSVEDVAAFLNVTRERIRQIEHEAIRSMTRGFAKEHARERRRLPVLENRR